MHCVNVSNQPFLRTVILWKIKTSDAPCEQNPWVFICTNQSTPFHDVHQTMCVYDVMLTYETLITQRPQLEMRFVSAGG